MRHTLLAVAVAIAVAGCSKAPAPSDTKDQTAGASAASATEQDNTLYALGAAIGRNVAPFDLSEAELKKVQEGIADVALHKEPKLDPGSYFPNIQELHNTRLAAAAAAEKQVGDAYLAKAAAEAGAHKTESGLVYSVITEGTGPSPKATDTVKVHYHGTLPSGKVFDSSVQRNEPATFPLNGVIPCWTEGVQLMKVGGKSRLICPAALAYGDRGAPPDIKPGATLVFEVELLGIETASGK